MLRKVINQCFCGLTGKSVSPVFFIHDPAEFACTVFKIDTDRPDLPALPDHRKFKGFRISLSPFLFDAFQEGSRLFRAFIRKMKHVFCIFIIQGVLIHRLEKVRSQRGQKQALRMNIKMVHRSQSPWTSGIILRSLIRNLRKYSAYSMNTSHSRQILSSQYTYSTFTRISTFQNPDTI